MIIGNTFKGPIDTYLYLCLGKREILARAIICSDPSRISSLCSRAKGSMRVNPHILAVFVASFLASSVEFVEAFTIVLVIGVSVNWRSSLAGAGIAVVALAVIVAALGLALVSYVPIDVLRLVVGILLVLFGLKWLKKSILRYGNLETARDEEAIYERWLATMKARREPVAPRIDAFGVITSFKSVLLEGLEVAFIVITFGVQAGAASRSNGIAAAALGAAIALVLVTAVSAVVRAPLQRVPENTLKFVVGLMLTTFGLFWGGEGLGIEWWGDDLFLVAIVVLNLSVTGALIFWTRSQTTQWIPMQSRNTVPTSHHKEANRGNPVVKVLRSIYNFFSGDSILLIFTLIAFGLVAVLLRAFQKTNALVAIIFIAIVVAGLTATLAREIALSARDHSPARS
jgi:uncharacterized membrane protein